MLQTNVNCLAAHKAQVHMQDSRLAVTCDRSEGHKAGALGWHVGGLELKQHLLLQGLGEIELAVIPLLQHLQQAQIHLHMLQAIVYVNQRCRILSYEPQGTILHICIALLHDMFLNIANFVGGESL